MSANKAHNAAGHLNKKRKADEIHITPEEQVQILKIQRPMKLAMTIALTFENWM